MDRNCSNCRAPLSWHEIAALRRLKSDSKHQASNGRWQLLLSMGLIVFAGGRPRELAVVLDGLYGSNIAGHVDISSTIDTWIGEEAGPNNQASFAIGNEQGAAQWLHRTAITLFPASKYAWKHSRMLSLVGFLARRWNPF
jgi:hypothetical protein